ncbi:hypothetical protein LTR02_004416 [Friedmanniomyces endolithicus]|nr:hypothetical protein LTR02_004416 [Friedmanniomyces endolithicus]
MRASSRIPVLLAALASVAVSVSIPGLPACAGNCVTSFGNCAQLAVGCICSDTTLLANLACCVGSNCDAADQNKATRFGKLDRGVIETLANMCNTATITFADALCAGQSVTNLPMAATCAPGADSTPLGTASSSGSSTTGSSSATTSAPASASSASTASGSAASVASSAATTSAPAAASTSKSAGEMGYGVGAAGLGLVFAGIVAAL